MSILKLTKATDLRVFRDLKKFTSHQVELVNSCSGLFKEIPSWEGWIEETLQVLLEVPCGLKLEITQTSKVDGDETRQLTFEQEVVSIGRASDSGLALSSRFVSARHARITERDGAYHLEDLNSANGTYVNSERLESMQPRKLMCNDEILIFPFTFRVRPQQRWGSDKEIKLSSSYNIIGSGSTAFASSLGSDFCLFRLNLQPDMGYVILAVSRSLLKTINSRLTRDEVAELAALDVELFEFVVVSILERINRELQFPFQCYLTLNSATSPIDEQGIALKAMVNLANSQGSMQGFIPQSCLHKVKATGTNSLPTGTRQQLQWKAWIQIGFVDLSASNLADLEPTDILVYMADLKLVLPQAPGRRLGEHGWYLVRDDTNSRRFTVKDHFERNAIMEEVINVPEHKDVIDKADLATLPLRIEVVLSQVELSLKDLEAMTMGSIIELDKENIGTVQLVVGGKVLGSGDLVEIDERFGVQITRWRKD
jgi:type III secretion system YscQ/HrcQ family protein